MIKTCAGEAGEGVDDTAYLALVIQHHEGVNRIMIHRLAGFHDLGILANRLGIAGHNVRYRRCEEGLSESLHRTTDISVRNDADELLVIHHHTYA